MSDDRAATPAEVAAALAQVETDRILGDIDKWLEAYWSQPLVVELYGAYSSLEEESYSVVFYANTGIMCSNQQTFCELAGIPYEHT